MQENVFRRKVLSALTALFLFFGMTAVSHAALINNGDGTVTQARIDGSSLMWLQDANAAKTTGYDSDGYMTWYQSNFWIDSLNSANYLGYNDWRLPDTNPVNGRTYNYSWFYDGSSDSGYNISAPGSAYPGSTGSEMAYMYYYELGNLGYYNTSGSGPQPGWGLTNTGPFTNLQPYYYLSGTKYVPDYAWYFYFYYGLQGYDYEDYSTYGYAWAVRPGPAAVPEPGTLFLLGTGLSGLFVLRKRARRLHG